MYLGYSDGVGGGAGQVVTLVTLSITLGGVAHVVPCIVQHSTVINILTYQTMYKDDNQVAQMSKSKK